ncbi:MAG: ribonuclease HII [Cyanobacteria bacterium P01_C01_bin.73]
MGLWESGTTRPLLRHLIAGVDEVGRGALFGPVVAAAALVSESDLERLAGLGVCDSKQLSAKRRQHLYPQVLAAVVDCQIGWSSPAEIDRLNILQASLLAMRRAVIRLKPQPGLCWVDGNQQIPQLPIPQQTWIKGDQESMAIAAASIVAKVWRDRLIIRLAQRYPQYDLAANKGYGSARHRKAIQQCGPTRYHRHSFKPCQI